MKRKYKSYFITVMLIAAFSFLIFSITVTEGETYSASEQIVETSSHIELNIKSLESDKNIGTIKITKLPDSTSEISLDIEESPTDIKFINEDLSVSQFNPSEGVLKFKTDFTPSKGDLIEINTTDNKHISAQLSK